MRLLSNFLHSLNRDAALDSFRNVLAVLGIGTIMGWLAAMRWFFVLPGGALLTVIWYADYLRHDL